MDQREAGVADTADNDIGNPSWRAVTTLNGSAFVAAAYGLVLCRAPEEGGGAYYLNRLRTGVPKLLILGELQDSVEGRARGVPLPGLRRAVRLQRLALAPLVGDWLARLLGAERMTKRHRRDRALEQQAFETALAPRAPATPEAGEAGTMTVPSELSIEQTGARRPVTFEFEYAWTSSPASVGENSDTRDLAVGFRRLKITATSTARTLCDIDFTAGGNSGAYVRGGFGETEQWGTWSVAKRSTILLWQEFGALGPLLFELDAKPYAGAFTSMPFTLTSSLGHRHECLIADHQLIVNLGAELNSISNVALTGPTPRRIFDDPKLQQGFQESGYAPLPAISAADVAGLLARFATLKPDDNFAPTGRSGFDHRYHCSFLDTNVGYKREAHRLVREFFDPYVARHLNGYQILTSNFNVKPPGKGKFSIHQNWPDIADLDDTTVTLWCPLVDVVESNGALQFVAGSHKLLPHVEGLTCPAYFHDFREELLAKYLKAIPMRVGEVMAFDDSLIHYSGDNQSDEARIAIQILCVPTDAQPAYFFFDKDKPDQFEVIAIDEEFFLTTDAAELTTRQPKWNSLGFIKNRNSRLSEPEFAALLDKGDEIRRRIYDGGGETPQAAIAGVEPAGYPDHKLGELEGRGYTIEPFLDTSDLEVLTALYGETTRVVSSDYHVSTFIGDPEIRRRIYEGIATVVQDKLEALAPGYRLVMASFVTTKANSTRGRLGLHQDYSLVDHGAHLGLNVWIPLVDVDARNACLRVVEGSQVFGHISANPPNPAPYWNVRQTLDSGVYLRDVPMAGGQAFLFDTLVLHATEENQTDSDRIAVSLNLAPVNVPARLYQWHERDPDRLEVWEVDSEFYLRMAPNTYIESPDLMGAKFVGRIEYKFEKLTPSDLQGSLPAPGPAPTPAPVPRTIEAIRDARFPVKAHDTADVKTYYDDKTPAYIEGFGEVFQGSRPESTDDLLQYIVEAAKIADGMKILDAGCGVCGPATWFAEHLDVTIEALTISPVQVREAQTRVNARGLAGRLNVREGDFHELVELYPPETFDRVLFLETICHARDYRRVLEQAKRVLKPGGYLYIKDFYCQDFRSRPELLETQREDLQKLNTVYRLVVPDIASTVDLIQELGFRLNYVREPSYEAVFGPWLKYEQAAGIAWNPKLSYLDLISGLEIFCRKPEASAAGTASDTKTQSVEIETASINPKTRSILISEPNATNANPFLPYVWGVLKTSAEADDMLAQRFVWLDPIHRTGHALNLLAAYDLSALDVLGLSCYTWNFDLQCEIAAIAKAANPDVLVVAGGPHPAVNRPDFFRQHPYIDVVVRQDGELTFNKLLTAICLGTAIAAIPGLCLPSKDDRTPIATGKSELPVHFERSPYIEQSAYFKRLLAEYGPGKFSAVWETNRGCPYSCSFCDWGSNTMSKIRRFDFARVEREAEWLAQMHMRTVFLADANFGIFPRDVDIARRLVDFYELHGGPRTLYYSPAKNNPDRALAVARILLESKMVAVHTLAIQHTDPVVLASMSRQNISPDKQRDVALQLLDAGIPIDVQLIIGIPGDSYDRWKNCLSDLMTWGIHEDYFISFFNLLPNAPAAEPEFIEKWGIRTAYRRTHNYSFQITRNPEEELIREHVVFQSNEFTSDEWVAMNVYTSFVRALHCHSFTRLIANYLHATHGLSYREFYEILIEGFFKNEYDRGQIFAEINEHYRSALAEDGVLDEADLTRLLGFPCVLSVARSIFVRLSLNVESFFDQLQDFLVKRFASVSNLGSIIQFQRNILILPSYDASVGKSFRADHDWLGYFSVALRRSARGTVSEPVELQAATIFADDTTCGDGGLKWSIDWSGLKGDDRLRAWLTGVVCARMCSRSSNLRSLSVRAGSQALCFESAA